jgi:hypothetical protein
MVNMAASMAEKFAARPNIRFQSAKQLAAFASADKVQDSARK